MSNTTQKPPAKGTSDSMWNTRFETNTGKTGASYGSDKNNWNARFDKVKTPTPSDAKR